MDMWTQFLDAVKKFDWAHFNYFILLWPAALGVFLIFFFRAYRRDIRPKAGTLEWIHWEDKPPFTLEGRRGQFKRRDIFPMLLITALYALVAFWNIGDDVAPQSFWKATREEPTVTVDLGTYEVIDTAFYYSGLGHGNYTLSFSEDGEIWRDQPGMTQPYSDTFKWRYAALESEKGLTRYVRITAQNPPMELGELVLVGLRDGERKALSYELFSDLDGAQALFDEQGIIPNRPTYLNSMIFDEIYHGYTAYQHLHEIYPYETTHPPLGKLLLAVGVEAFGMTPYGWRFMGILFGVLMVPLMYLLIKNLFGKTRVAVCGTLLFAFDFMHFAQTRIATIDTYGVFFTILMIFFMYRVITAGYETPMKSLVLPTLGAGLAFGLGASSKWTGFYAFLGIFALALVYLYLRGRHYGQQGRADEHRVFMWKYIPFCVICFAVIPAIIYTLSYIPYAQTNGGLTLENLFDNMWNNSNAMLRYHSGVTDGHPYEARWFLWLIDARPILFYADWQTGTRSSIASFTSPLIAWGGLAAIVSCSFALFRRKSREALFILIGYAANLLPWLFISRITFAYHYFPSVIFLTLALCYVMNAIFDRGWRHRFWCYALTAIGILLFILFIPPLSGYTVSNEYYRWVTGWFPSWTF